MASPAAARSATNSAATSTRSGNPRRPGRPGARGTAQITPRVSTIRADPSTKHKGNRSPGGRRAGRHAVSARRRWLSPGGGGAGTAKSEPAGCRRLVRRRPRAGVPPPGPWGSRSRSPRWGAGRCVALRGRLDSQTAPILYEHLELVLKSATALLFEWLPRVHQQRGDARPRQGAESAGGQRRRGGGRHLRPPVRGSSTS